MYRCNHCGHKVANPSKHWREHHDGRLYFDIDFRKDGEPKPTEKEIAAFYGIEINESEKKVEP